MSVLTPARFGLARMGATRMGYPILAGVRVPTYALFGVARLGATRLNYHSPTVFVTVNGVHVATGAAVDGQQIDNDTLSISDILNETPNTARCTTRGFLPVEGHEVIITLGSKNNLIREFGGRILSQRAYFVGTAANYHHDLSLIDYTWDLNRIKVRKRYTSTTVAVIAADLIATYAPGFTVLVAPDIGAEPIDEITFTEQDLASCLTNLTKRVEGDWTCDYHQVVKLFYEDTSETNPTILNAVHPTLDKPAFAMIRDLSQILTRVYVEGGGVNAGASVGVGDTILPLDGAIDWYEILGGVVVCGPQRITYTGRYEGGGGGLVGTGAAPSGAPVLALAPGAGISDGTRSYGVTFVTPAGESIAGPVATITTGLTPAPASAPVAAAPTIGSGPDPGSHDYGVTFVTASGETTASPLVTRATDLTPDPVAYPVPGTPTVGTGPDDGTHEYAATFVTSIGETKPGLISPPVLTGPLAAPGSAPSGTASFGTGPDTGSHQYAATFITAAGETTAGPSTTIATGVTAAPTGTPASAATATIGSGPDPGTHDYAVTFVTATGETTEGPRLTKATDVTPAPTSAPTFGAATVGTGPDLGSHNYVVTFITSVGETTPSPIGTTVIVPIAPPAAPTVAQGSVGGFLTVGATYELAYAYSIAATNTDHSAETTIGPASTPIVALSDGSGGSQRLFVTVAYSTDPAVTWLQIYRRVNGGVYHLTSTVANNPAGGTVLGSIEQISDAAIAGQPSPSATNTAGAYRTVHLTGIPTGGANVTSRRIYRTLAGGSTLQWLDELANNFTTTYTDITVDASIAGGATIAPTVNTAHLQRIALTAIPTGPSEVTSRKIYRTAAGGSQLKLVTTLANNFTTTYTDTVTDASLGANVPMTNTASLNRIALTGIPLGPTGIVTQRKIYRTEAGGSIFYHLTTIANNSSTTYTDTTPDASLSGVTAPTTNTAAMNVVPLTGIPVGDANVTSRKIYRRSGGAGLKLVGTIANNFTTTFTDTVANASLGAAAPTSSTAYLQRIALSAIPIGSALVTSRKIYRTAAGGAQLKLLTTLANNTTTTFLDTITDASLGANVPTSNTATANQVSLTSIPIGASAVTQRKIYRTAAGGAQLKLLTTIADNVTSTYTDSIADGSLGANVPTVDTSGLAQPQGNVIAGSTSLQIASIGAFPPQGWAVIGNGQQVIRYTGISGTVLTGIPASGPGSIQATIAFNSTVTAPPQLTGIPSSGAGSILYPILKGDEANLFVQVDDLDAQAKLSALRDPLNLLGGAAGIQEDSLQDRRLSHREALARGAAHLAARRDVAISLRFQTRDINTRAGRTIRVNLGAPFNLFGAEFMIQQVTTSKFRPAMNPTYDVSASSVRLTFDDLLRKLLKVG